MLPTEADRVGTRPGGVHVGQEAHGQFDLVKATTGALVGVDRGGARTAAALRHANALAKTGK